MKNFDVVIADDGSDGRTKEVIESYRRRAPFAIQHFWQENQGFRKSRILNEAIRAVESLNEMPGGKAATVEQDIADLRRVKNGLDAARPHVVCPACHGAGKIKSRIETKKCGVCGGHKFVTKRGLDIFTKAQGKPAPVAKEKEADAPKDEAAAA